MAERSGQDGHTPGPWEWSHHRIWSGANEVLSFDARDSDRGRVNISQADADLIIRAPELLDEHGRLRKLLYAAITSAGEDPAGYGVVLDHTQKTVTLEGPTGG